MEQHSGAEQQWNPGHYDSHFGFVSRFGEDVIGILQPQRGERILDLGCGTGDLTARIAEAGCETVGIDLSPDMIAQAEAKYPHLTFAVADGESFRAGRTFDAVFSNAALHWMKRPEAVVACVRDALRTGGRFVAEFGGRGNVEAIVRAVEEALPEQASRNPWYFPSVGEYASLLERHGFRVMLALHFDRPTPLSGGEQGLRHWFAAFGAAYMAGLSASAQEEALARIEAKLRPSLFDAERGAWIGDYRRLRMMAVKQPGG